MSADTAPVAGALAGARIVIANNFAGPGMGGGEVQMLAVCKELRAQGANLVAVVLPGSAFGLALDAMGARVVETVMGPANMLGAIRAIRAQIVPGALVVGTGYWTGILTRLAARSLRAGVVSVVGSSPENDVTGSGGTLAARIRGWLDRGTRARVNLYIAVSDDIATSLKSAGIPDTIIEVIPNGVDIKRLRELAQHVVRGAKVEGRHHIVVVARLEPVKGVEYLIRAMSGLPDADLTVVGDGSLAEPLKSLVLDLGLGDRVRFLGHVSPSAPLIASADVVVLPSLSEGLPLVLLEAMAMGAPVVATGVGGIPAAVEFDTPDGGVGSAVVLVQPKDANAIAAAVRAILDDPGKVRQMTSKAMSLVEQKHDSEAMGRTYAKRFAEVQARATDIT